ELVRGSPDSRRHWLDTLLIQLEPVYAHILHQYNQTLRQRNAFLKRYINTQEKSLQSELAIWNAQLVTAGTRVILRRNRVIQRMTNLASHWHKNISRSSENLQIKYAANVPLEINSPHELQNAFFAKLQQRAVPELHRGITLVGPHRDEIELIINQSPARKYA
ncbi:MAG: DNA replication and repair protein RecF, partial [Dolichospermum sp.]